MNKILSRLEKGEKYVKRYLPDREKNKTRNRIIAGTAAGLAGISSLKTLRSAGRSLLLKDIKNGKNPKGKALLLGLAALGLSGITTKQTYNTSRNILRKQRSDKGKKRK